MEADVKLNFRGRSRLSARVFAVLVIIGVASITTFSTGWIVSNAYNSYKTYINRPDYVFYTSKLGSISLEYPSYMQRDTKLYGEHIEGTTIRASYNASSVTDDRLKKASGLVFVSVHDMTCRYKDCETPEEFMKRDRDIFLNVYFNETSKTDDKSVDIKRTKETHFINGHEAQYYNFEKKEKSSGIFTRNVYISVRVNSTVYTLQAFVKDLPWNYTGKIDYIDRLINSIKIAG